MAKARPLTDLRPERPLIENAAAAIPTRLAELCSWAPYVENPVHVRELHEMRIAAKRLRYTMEMFRPCFGEWFKRAVETARDIQELLGTIHDLDVLQERVWHYANTAGEMERLRPVIEDIAARRARRHREFADFWQTLESERFGEALLNRLYSVQSEGSDGAEEMT